MQSQLVGAQRGRTRGARERELHVAAGPRDNRFTSTAIGDHVSNARTERDDCRYRRHRHNSTRNRRVPQFARPSGARHHHTGEQPRDRLDLCEWEQHELTHEVRDQSSREAGHPQALVAERAPYMAPDRKHADTPERERADTTGE